MERVTATDISAARETLALAVEQVARVRYREGRRWHPWDSLRPAFTFLRVYLLSLGFLDGLAGLAHARLCARYRSDLSRWLRRLDREIGGARGRGRVASALRGAGRGLVVRLAALVFPKPKAGLLALPSIRKILVIRSDERVGNQLLTTPLVRALAVRLPHAEVHLLAAARQAPVIDSPHVKRLIPFEKRLFFRRPWRFLGLLRELRARRYDLVIEAAHWSAFSLTATLLARFTSGDAPSIGHDRGETARFLSHPVQHDPANGNEVRAKLELLRPLGILSDGLELETGLGSDPALRGRMRNAAGVREPYAVLNPGARMADRRWAPSAHAAVARGLMDRGLSVLVVWGPGEEHIARAVAEAANARLAPATSLPELAALLRGARLCVSNDTGPMHLSVAVGTATVGVFVASEARRWGHDLPIFEPAEPAGDGGGEDAEVVLAACDRVLWTTRPRGGELSEAAE
jgi:ADP-heptose:LPS heptosyltransferase